jgi:hypothetical protein
MNIYTYFKKFNDLLEKYQETPKLDTKYKIVRDIPPLVFENYSKRIGFIILSLCDQYLSPEFGDQETDTFVAFLNATNTRYDKELIQLFLRTHRVTGWKSHSVSVIEENQKYILCNSHVSTVYDATDKNLYNPICVVRPNIRSQDKIVYNFVKKNKLDFFRESNLFPNIILDNDDTYLCIYGDIQHLSSRTIFKTFDNTLIPNRKIFLHIYDKSKKMLFEYCFAEDVLDEERDSCIDALRKTENRTFLELYERDESELPNMKFGEVTVNCQVRNITYKIVKRSSSWEDTTLNPSFFLHDLKDGTFEYPCNVQNLQKGGSCTVFSKFYALLYLYIKQNGISPKDHHNTQIKLFNELQQWSFQHFTYYSQLYMVNKTFYTSQYTNPFIDIAFYIAIVIGLVKITGENNVFYEERGTIKEKWKTILKRTQHNHTNIEIQTYTDKVTDIVPRDLIGYIQEIYENYSLPELYYLSCIPLNEFNSINYINTSKDFSRLFLEENNSFFGLSVYHRLLYKEFGRKLNMDPCKPLHELGALSTLHFPITSICAYETPLQAKQNCKSYFCVQLFPTVFQFNKTTETVKVEFGNIPMHLPNRDQICDTLLKYHLACLRIKTESKIGPWGRLPMNVDEIEKKTIREDSDNKFKDCLASHKYKISYFFPMVYNMPSDIQPFLEDTYTVYNDFIYLYKRCEWYNIMTNDYDIPLEMRLQLNVYFNRPLTTGMKVNNLYCSSNVVYILGLNNANLMDDDVNVDMSSLKRSYIEWAIYMHIHHYGMDRKILNRLENLLKILHTSKLLLYYSMVDETFNPIRNYNLPILISEGNVKKTESGASLSGVHDPFMIFWHGEFKIKEYIFLKIQCINVQGHFLHLIRHGNKWYMDLEHKIQVHTTDIPKLNSHKFSWGMKIHPVTNNTSKVISYLVIQKNTHKISKTDTKPVYCEELEMKYVPQETEYVYTYINVQGEALICDTKNDLELITMCVIENKRHDVYARLYPQLYCFPDVKKDLLDPEKANYPFANMQNNKPTLYLERNGYEDWDSPVIFLDHHFLPINLQITRANKHNFNTYKDILEYGLQRKMDMRPDQIELLNNIINADFQYTFVQRTMGAGKTSVLLPFLALYYMYQHILKGNTPLETYTLMIVPYPQLIEQVFRRFLHAMGWTGVVQIQIRTEMKKMGCPYKFETRRGHIPLVIVCTDAWVKYQMIMETFVEITNRPVFASMDEYDEMINPYRSRFILYEDSYHGKKLSDVLSSDFLRIHILIFDEYVKGEYNETNCVERIQQFKSSEQFVHAAWYLAVREIFNYTYLLHFGLHPDKLFAVPYIAQGLFSKNEEFEDPMFRVIATLYSILRDGTNSFQNKKYFQYLKENKYEKEYVPTSWCQLYTTKYLSLDKIYPALRPLKSIDDICQFMEHIIIKNTQLSGTMFSCATPHMFSHIRQGIMSAQTKVIGMTGTLRPEDIPSKVFPERNVIFDDEWTQVIQLLDRSTHINLTEDPCTMESYLNKMNETIQQQDLRDYRHHHAYIDVGATNLTYDAGVIGNVEKTIRHIIGNELKDQGYTHVIFPGKGNEPYILDCKTKNSMRYNDRMPGTNEKWLYYFDHPHCRGYDVKTIFNNIIVPILGFVMVSADNMLNEVAQAAFRLRYLLHTGHDQKLILIYPQQINQMEHLTQKQNEQYVSRVALLTEQIEKSEKDNEEGGDIKREEKTAWFINPLVSKCNEEIQFRLEKNMKTALLERSVRTELNVEVKQELNINVEQEIANTFLNIRDIKVYSTVAGCICYVHISFAEGNISDSIHIEPIPNDTMPEFTLREGILRFCKSVDTLLCPHMYEFELNLIMERYDIFCEHILGKKIEQDIIKYECLYFVLSALMKLYNKNIYPLLVNTSLTFQNQKIILTILKISESETPLLSHTLDPNYLPIERHLKQLLNNKKCERVQF